MERTEVKKIIDHSGGWVYIFPSTKALQILCVSISYEAKQMLRRRVWLRVVHEGCDLLRRHHGLVEKTGEKASLLY